MIAIKSTAISYFKSFDDSHKVNSQSYFMDTTSFFFILLIIQKMTNIYIHYTNLNTNRSLIN